MKIKGSTVKRICLFAGYNYNNKISEYVVDYIKELSNYADIYYLADGILPQEELLKITPFIKSGWILNHHKYDFGSYSELAKNYVGWEIIEKYDELILANDSCMCVNSFGPVFQKMDSENIDVWGLLFTDETNTEQTFDSYDYLKKDENRTKELCLGTYFISIRSSFFKTEKFKNFLNSVEVLNSRAEVCARYERGFYLLLLENKLKVASYCERVYRYSTTYMNEAFMLIKNGFPLLKVRIFVDNIGQIKNLEKLSNIINKFCDFPFLPYIYNIRNERNVIINNQEINKNVKSFKLRNIIKYIFPMFMQDFYHFVRNNYKKNKKSNTIYKNLVKYFTPKFIHDFVKLPKKIKNIYRNKLRFSLKERPPYGGYYPCHIKNYSEIQNNRLNKALENYNGNIVIFFNVMREVLSGGMLSIDRLTQHASAMMKDVTVLQSGLPLNNAIIDNPYFDYSIMPVSFKFLAKKVQPKKLLLNIPEGFLPDFICDLTEDEKLWLWSIPDFQINILNQSDELMPPIHFIEEARLLCCDKLTITAAHQRYCNKENKYNCPMYLLTPFLPDFYLSTYEEKEKIIVLSPDINEYKESIVTLLKNELLDFQFITVNKMKLEDYKKLISKAMFTITFGEGYDGYFIEPALSGSISFAVYNEIYFPKKICKLDSLYSSWNEMKQNIVNDIKKYVANPVEYNLMSSLLRKEVKKYTNDDLSNSNLQELYLRFMKD